MSMKRSLLGVIVSGVLSSWVSASAAEAGGDAANTNEEQIRTWIGKLASDEFAVREEATEKLASCGPAARKALEEAAESGDPEVRFRARTALGRIGRGGTAFASPEEKGAVSRRAATSVSIEQGPQGIRISVTEDLDGKSGKTVYEAPDRETFRKKHPEIFEKYLGDGGLDAGGLKLFMNGPAQALIFQNDEEGLDMDLGIDELLEQQERIVKQFRTIRVPQTGPARRDLGILIDGLPEALSAQLGITGGALVTDVVPGGTAARAGIARWDIVTAFAGKKISSAAELAAALREWTGERPAAVSVIRGGQTRELQVSLDAAAAGK